MRLWISSDMTKSLKDDNQQSFLHLTELGWEMVVGRLKVIRMMGAGQFKPTDTVITIADRTFMYPFCKVEAFNPETAPNEQRADFVPRYTRWLNELHANRTTPWAWPKDIEKIRSFDFMNITPPACVVINHRVRKWDPGRNSDEEGTRKLVSMALSLGLKPYISGRYADKVDDRAEHIPTLRELASIVNHDNCKCFFATGGTIMLGQQCCKNKMVVRNLCGDSEKHFRLHPLWMSDRLNFSGCEQYLINRNDWDSALKLMK